MNSFDIPWDLSQPTTFSQLADDDFLALLQKQFPTSNGGLNVSGGFNANAGINAVNPQSLSALQLAGTSNNPSSADSTPSPPSATNGNRRGMSASQDLDDDGAHDSALKRKASDDDFEDGQGSSKKGSRKRTSSGGDKDDNRLQKRKEQNRAAQRAFRERKEKHVKDLEDKVAELESKNDTQQSENENLRDLLQRLQSENMALKAQQASFTFSVPKPNSNGNSNTNFSTNSFSPDNMMFSGSPSFSSPSSSSSPSNPLDFSSLQAFDPNVLNLLDEPQQQTATSSAMSMDFGFEGSNNNDALKNTFLNNYTVIANNPQFLSLASMFDATPSPVPPTQQVSSPQQHSTPDTNAFNFDMSGLTSWPRDPSGGGLDEFFGSFMNNNSMDLGGFGGAPGSTEGSSTISPIVHHQAPSGLFAMSNASPASASSPESQKSDSIFTPHESSASESEVEMDHSNNPDCPRTRGEMVERMHSEGPSTFTSPPPTAGSSTSAAGDSCELGGSGLSANLARKKGGDEAHVACQTGSTFPRTEKSPENIEVLNAWKKITAAPGFKEADINELCTEFSKKARCDGTHVVLEPSGVDDILQTMQHKGAHGAMSM